MRCSLSLFLPRNTEGYYIAKMEPFKLYTNHNTFSWWPHWFFIWFCFSSELLFRSELKQARDYQGQLYPPHAVIKDQPSISEKGHVWRIQKVEELLLRVVMQWFAQKDGFLQLLFRYWLACPLHKCYCTVHSDCRYCCSSDNCLIFL